MRRPGSFAALAVVLMIATVAFADDGKWGTLKGRFIYDGQPPMPSRFDDGSLRVDSESRGIANVCVFLRERGISDLRVHPEYDQSAKELVQIVFQDDRIVPRISSVRTGQPLAFVTEGKLAHNPHTEFVKNHALGILLPKNDAFDLVLPVSEPVPVRITDDLHPELQGYLLVSDTPYVAISRIDGTFEIRNLPVGEHTFQFWHERTGYVRLPEIERTETVRPGRLRLDIVSGENDLGDIAVPDGQFGVD